MTEKTTVSLQQVEQEAPKIEFPCDYSVRIVGTATEDFQDYVLGVVKKHDPKHDGKSSLRPSRNGTFVSVVVNIWATGEDQLRALHNELKESGRVKIVL